MKAIKSNMKDQILTDDKKILYCSKCGVEYSGNSGDYWNYPKDYVFTCNLCGIELELVDDGARQAKMKPYSKEFFGMKYPFNKCARLELLKSYRTACLDCSVERFCEAPEKKYYSAKGITKR